MNSFEFTMDGNRYRVTYSADEILSINNLNTNEILYENIDGERIKPHVWRAAYAILEEEII